METSGMLVPCEVLKDNAQVVLADKNRRHERFILSNVHVVIQSSDQNPLFVCNTILCCIKKEINGN